MSDIRRILLVCTGNSCRSVMAKGLLKKIISEREDLASKKIIVMSAGTGTIPGRGTTRETIEVMFREGIDVSGHLTQILTDRTIVGVDLILVMESFHKDVILRRVPRAKNKVHLITEYCRPEGEDALVDPDVPDPIGRSIEVYEKSLEVIRESVERIVNVLWP